MQKTRPTSITVISWVVVILAGLSLIGNLVTLFTYDRPEIKEVLSKSPLPIFVQLALGFLGTILTGVSGIGLFKAKAWARLLLIGWQLLMILMNVFTSGVSPMLIPGLVLVAVAGCFLFQPQANEYFSEQQS